MIYISIDFEQEKGKNNKRLIKRFLTFILPKANPDFDEKIPSVSRWFLEFENENSVPTREVGVNSDNKVLVKMPYVNNYGYWSDNNLTYIDFKKSFKSTTIDVKFFEDKWGELAF
jgi:hypothetical protein